VAEDFAMETYKNLPNDGMLKVRDPEGGALTYTVTRQPRRGTVELREDGSFTYTPKKNKVGTDSFTFTASDPGGNVSREATVTIQILKPKDAGQYADTLGEECRFEAEWLKNTGVFAGERIDGVDCFRPEKTVTRGEFLAMVIRVLDIPLEQTVYSSVPDNTPNWLKPYVAAAIRSGLTAGLPEYMDLEKPVSGAEAAVMIQNALDLSVPTAAGKENEGDLPVWLNTAIDAVAEQGITLDPTAALTREATARLLYQVSQMSKAVTKGTLY
jgi:hypothetical protein